MRCANIAGSWCICESGAIFNVTGRLFARSVTVIVLFAASAGDDARRDAAECSGDDFGCRQFLAVVALGPTRAQLVARL